jgi:hypothetical protein
VVGSGPPVVAFADTPLLFSLFLSSRLIPLMTDAFREIREERRAHVSLTVEVDLYGEAARPSRSSPYLGFRVSSGGGGGSTSSRLFCRFGSSRSEKL